jgi:hypothetical protein
MPVHDRSWSDQDERFCPSRPERSQRDPEQLMQDGQSTARSFGVQREQLLTESQVFEQEVFPGTESAGHPAEKMPEQYDHGENRTGIVRIELVRQVIHFLDVRRFGETQLNQEDLPEDLELQGDS